MKAWKIRITTKYINTEKSEISKSLKEISEKYLIVNEFKDDKQKPLDHIQMYIESETSERKLRALIKSFLKEGGNKAFSMDNRHTDWKGYTGYLLKYDDNIVLESSYTLDEIEEFKQYYFDVSKPKPTTRKELKLENDLEIILQKCQFNQKMTIREILHIIIEYYKENKKVIHLANINQLAWSVMTYTSDDNSYLIDKLLSQDEQFSQIASKEHDRPEKFNGREYPIEE